VNGGALSGVLELVVPPAVGTLVTLAVGGIVARLRKRERAAKGAEDEPDARAEPQPRARGWSLDLMEFLEGLHPPKRRPTPWKAALVGAIGVGFGVAGYFRTRADVLIGLVLTTPFFVALPFLPTETTGEEPEPSAPGWVYAAVYGTMGLTGLYAYFRADSAIPSQLPRKSWDERRDILLRELRLLRAGGWTPESVGDVQATVSRVRRPNHLLHLVLTLVTFFLWGVVWLVLTLQAHNRAVREYRLVSVDEFGDWRLEPLPQAPSVL
jgi:hypothetical protein